MCDSVHINWSWEQHIVHWLTLISISCYAHSIAYIYSFFKHIFSVPFFLPLLFTYLPKALQSMLSHLFRKANMDPVAVCVKTHTLCFIVYSDKFLPVPWRPCWLPTAACCRVPLISDLCTALRRLDDWATQTSHHQPVVPVCCSPFAAPMNSKFSILLRLNLLLDNIRYVYYHDCIMNIMWYMIQSAAAITWLACMHPFNQMN